MYQWNRINRRLIRTNERERRWIIKINSYGTREERGRGREREREKEGGREEDYV